MESDEIAIARMILDAAAELDRRGSEQMLHTLERVEPDLASFSLERPSLMNARDRSERTTQADRAGAC